MTPARAKKSDRALLLTPGAGAGRDQASLVAIEQALQPVPVAAKPAVFEVVRRALRWEGGPHAALLAFLADGGIGGGRDWRRFPTDERWALQVLGFGPDLDL